MSLAEVSDARKARLAALRRKRAGQPAEEEGYVFFFFGMISQAQNSSCCYRSAPEEPVLNTRNFDPETRTLRKRTQQDVELEDTIEKNVEGLAERIIAEDEERRAQDLVCCGRSSSL